MTKVSPAVGAAVSALNVSTLVVPLYAVISTAWSSSVPPVKIRIRPLKWSFEVCDQVGRHLRGRERARDGRAGYDGAGRLAECGRARRVARNRGQVRLHVLVGRDEQPVVRAERGDHLGVLRAARAIGLDVDELREPRGRARLVDDRDADPRAGQLLAREPERVDAEPLVDGQVARLYRADTVADHVQVARYEAQAGGRQPA